MRTAVHAYHNRDRLSICSVETGPATKLTVSLFSVTLRIGLSKSGMSAVFLAGPLSGKDGCVSSPSRARDLSMLPFHSPSGLIVQPIIGELDTLLIMPSCHSVTYLTSLSGSIADRSKSRFGRRRPVIVIGCLICVLSLLIFGYTREVASVFTTWGSNAVSTTSAVESVVVRTSNVLPVLRGRIALYLDYMASGLRSLCSRLRYQRSPGDR